MRHTLLATAAAAALLAAPFLANPTLAQTRDGTPGNPPSTATQRATDAVTGNRTPADGTPGNPPGTALGRAAERATGGAADANTRAGDPLNAQNRPDGTPGNPPGTAAGRAAADANNRAGDPLNLQNRPDGTSGNPPGTAAGRALDNATGSAAGANARAGDPANAANVPDGAPGNPPGTAVSRAIDRAVGSNISGAYPQNADGGASNPPGTAVGRAVDRATDGNERTPGPAAGAPSGPAATGANPGMMGSTQPNAANDMGARTGASPRDNSNTSDVRPGTTSIPLQGQAATSAPNNPPASASPRSATGTTASPAMGSGVTAGAAPYSDRASRIIGSNVYNERNESVGSVDDIILGGNAPGPMAVVSVGGFLGIGAKLVAVPFSQLRWAPADSRWVITGATRESLTSLPAYAYDAARRG